MSSRYKKIKEVMSLSAAKIEDDTFSAEGKRPKLTSSVSFFLLLSSSNSE